MLMCGRLLSSAKHPDVVGKAASATHVRPSAAQASVQLCSGAPAIQYSSSTSDGHVSVGAVPPGVEPAVGSTPASGGEGGGFGGGGEGCGGGGVGGGVGGGGEGDGGGGGGE
jgi:hypothetical protein